MSDTALALNAGPQRARPRALFVGTALAIVAITVFFGMMMAVYGNLRDSAGGTTDVWVPSDVLFRNAQLVFTLMTLVIGASLMAWAAHANRQGSITDVRIALVGAVLFGALHVNMVLYAVDSFGVGIGETWSNLVFPITGFAIVLSVLCMIFSAVMAVRAFGGQLGARNPGIEAASWLWYAQFVIWFFVFLGVFAVK